MEGLHWIHHHTGDDFDITTDKLDKLDAPLLVIGLGGTGSSRPGQEHPTAAAVMRQSPPPIDRINQQRTEQAEPPHDEPKKGRYTHG